MKAKASSSRLKLFLFGPPRLEFNGKPITVDTRKAIALMAYLAVSGKRHSRDHLAALLWPDADQTHAYGALRRTLSVLNTVLDGNGLEAQRAGVEITSDAWCDVSAFRSAIAQGKRGEGVELYRDDFMSGFTLRDSSAFDDWQSEQTEALRRELAHALETLVRSYVEGGEFETAIAHARRWLSLDPLDEAAHRQLMKLYAWSDDRSAALKQYRECVRVLDEELGVSPLEETTQLYEAIKANRDIPLAHMSNESAVERDGNVTLAVKSQLVGRAKEWSLLRQQYQMIGADGRFVALQGEAGIGKTRLAQTFLDDVKAQGAWTLASRCYEGEGSLAYAPFVEALRTAITQPDVVARFAQIENHWLSEVARLLPEVRSFRDDLPSPTPLDSSGAQTRFFEGMSQVLLTALRPSTQSRREQPGVLLIDDVHWADEATLDLLTYLVRRLRGKPVFILVAWRDEQLLPQHRLRQLLGEAIRDGIGAVISLSRLQPFDVQEWVKSALPSTPSNPTDATTLAERLYRESEGLPLFLAEYLAMVDHEGTITEANWTLPQTIRDLLRSRVSGLNETARQLLSTAAVIGRSFHPELLQGASGRNDEETAAGLEALASAGLVREANNGYDFNHEKLREFVYEETGLARRRLLHRRVAEALTARRWSSRGQRSPLDQQASLIAQHYRLAGKEAEAAGYFKRAGDYARSLFANAEALSHYRLALALGHTDAAELHEAIGDLQTLSGDYANAVNSYETAAASLTADDGRQMMAHRRSSIVYRLTSLEHKLGNVHHRRGEWALADSLYQIASETMGKRSDPEEKARLFADWSLNTHRQGDDARAQRLAEQSLSLAKRANNQRALSQAHNTLGMLARSRGDSAVAIESFERSLATAKHLNEPAARVAALNNLALVLADNDDPSTGAQGERALTLLEEALALCASQGDRHREAALHNNIADLLHSLGQAEPAMLHLTQAVKIFAEIGIGAGEWQAEIWKLTEW